MPNIQKKDRKVKKHEKNVLIISFLTLESGEGGTVLWNTEPRSDVYFLLRDGCDTMS